MVGVQMGNKTDEGQQDVCYNVVFLFSFVVNALVNSGKIR